MGRASNKHGEEEVCVRCFGASLRRKEATMNI
jgi:hypothetical protein